MLFKLWWAFVLLTLVAGPAQANDDKSHVIALNWISPIIGLYDVTYETKVARQYSWFLRGIYYNISNPTVLDIDGDNISVVVGEYSTTSPFTLWALVSSSGFNFWINDALTGPYLGAELLGGIIYSDGAVRDSTFGIFGKVGYRWIWNHVSLGPYIGLGTDFTDVGPMAGLSLGIAF